MAKKQKKEEYVELNGVLGNAFVLSCISYAVYRLSDRMDSGICTGNGCDSDLFRQRDLRSSCRCACCHQGPEVLCRSSEKNQRLKSLREQFKDLLESLSASYSAGRNTPDAFQDACNDMISIYGEESDIVRELELICTGLNNNINIEVLLTDFAERSGLDDVMSFAKCV